MIAVTRRLAVVLACAMLAAILAPASADQTLQSGDAYGSLGATEVVLGNDAIERRWSRDALSTILLADKRPGGATFSTPGSDFSIVLDGVRVHSATLPVTDVALDPVAGGGVRATFSLLVPGVAGLRREVEVYPGIAGFRSRTTVDALAPVVVSGYTLDEVAAGATPAATIHAFRSGSDWRFDAGWNPVSVGDAHKGDWRVQASAPAGADLRAPGEWLSLAYPDGRTLFMVMERRDYSSSRMAYEGGVAQALVDLSRDIVYTGPFEETIHAENPTASPARHRALSAGSSTPLEPAFTGVGASADDEPWQHFRYLDRHAVYPKSIVFNTDKVDTNARSTGAKDDADYDRFLTLLPAAREMGVETFVFDDGWMARSGDWCPDSPQCPEPRWDGSPTSKFRPRFPDDHFGAVNTALAGDPQDPSDDVALGLWMTPMNFHPRSTAYTTSPEWGCAPVGHGTGAVSFVQPDSSSFEPGIGVWNPEAWGTDPDTELPAKLIDYIQGRIERAITVFGSRYFKFDFLAWIDCAGVNPADMYAYHDSFVAMVDRLIAAHPGVTFTIDETNDYRMFPFESTIRGATWFQNGTPNTRTLLHNLWNLAPYVPGFGLGQHALGDTSLSTPLAGIDVRMAAALGSHITFWLPIDTRLTSAQRARVKAWTGFYKAERDTLATFTYPLLADPSADGWTALQPWNPQTGRGWLLAFRQNAAAASASIPLRGVPDGSYALTLEDPGAGTVTPLGTFDAASLRAGVSVAAAAGSYAIVRIEPV